MNDEERMREQYLVLLAKVTYVLFWLRLALAMKILELPDESKQAEHPLRA